MFRLLLDNKFIWDRLSCLDFFRFRYFLGENDFLEGSLGSKMSFVDKIGSDYSISVSAKFDIASRLAKEIG